MAAFMEKLMSGVALLLICWMPGIRSLKESFRDGQLNIVGESQIPYEVFEETGNKNLETLEIVRLEKVEFRPQNLLKLLRPCLRLRKIDLHQVTWTGEFKDKLNLPELSSVEIRRKNWAFSGSTPGEFLDILFFANLDNTTQLPQSEIGVYTGDGYFSYEKKSLRIFKIPYDTQQYFTYTALEVEKSVIDLSKFIGSGVTSISIRNSTLFKGSSADFLGQLDSVQELILDDLSFQDGDSVYDLRLLAVHSLEQLKLYGAQLVYSSNGTSDLIFPVLTTLELRDVTFNWLGIQSPKETKILRIFDTSFVGAGFEFVTKMESLEDLRLVGVTVGADQSDFDLAWLSNSRETIKFLYLANLRLTLSQNFKLKKISTLILGNCTLDQSLLQSFSSTFEAVRSVSLINQISDNLLQALMKTSLNSLYLNEERPLFGEENVLVNQFLRTLNISSTFPVEVSLYKEWGAWKAFKQYEIEAEVLAAMKSTDAVHYIYVSALTLICGIGILGNVVSVVVLLRKAMRSSTSCLMTALALFDIMILTTAAASLPLYAFKLQALFLPTYGITRSDYMGDREGLLQEKLQAKATLLGEVESSLIYPLSKTAYTASVYLTILLTLERFAAVCYPLQVKLWTSKKKAIWSSVLVLLLAILVNIPRWLEANGATMKIRVIHTPRVEWAFKIVLYRIYSGFNIMQIEAYRKYYHGYFWTLLMYILPLPLLCFLNAKIWTQTRSSVMRRRQLSSSATEGDLTSLTLMLLCVSVCFVLCNATNWAIVWILVSLEYGPRDIDVFATVPIVVNSSTNFFFYCFLGKKFRAELNSLLRGCYGFCHCLTKSSTEASQTARTSALTGNRNVVPSKIAAETRL